jgi:bifunctional UDP-N-acetylglucosamine pyrophosphorylase / glucosamine-1-phosphate N-acetyltransferase
MSRTCLFIILAAGEGTRMRSTLPKALHRIAGKPIVSHVVATASSTGIGNVALVVGSGAEDVRGAARAELPGVEIFEQKQRLGTAHAVLAARDAISRGYDDIVVLFADTPLVRAETIVAMRQGLAAGAAAVILGFRTDKPDGYGRLLEKDGELLAVREDRDASRQEREIRFCNAGIMALDGANALADLDAISNDNAKNEYYLTEIVEIVRKRGGKTVAMEARESDVLGINTREDLAEAELAWQGRRRRELLLAGVTMQAPETVFLSHDTVLGTDCELEPNIRFGEGVELESGVTVRAFSHLEGCHISSGAVIGPFARIRPGTTIAEGVRIGNFCELKNADVATGAKINHLSYVGDASVGANANIGAGTITCNYDGFGKYRTEIGDNAFIGSNSALVAPVKIGDGAYIASGSVIVADVPSGSLGIARGRQAIKEGYAARIGERAKSKRKKR